MTNARTMISARAELRLKALTSEQQFFGRPEPAESRFLPLRDGVASLLPKWDFGDRGPRSRRPEQK